MLSVFIVVTDTNGSNFLFSVQDITVIAVHCKDAEEPKFPGITAHSCLNRLPNLVQVTSLHQDCDVSGAALEAPYFFQVDHCWSKCLEW